MKTRLYLGEKSDHKSSFLWTRNVVLALVLFLNSWAAWGQEEADTRNQSPRPATAVFSVTANNGLYANRIPLIRLAVPYSEICFKNGQMRFDLHNSGGSTRGGNCRPGNVGWIIEQTERGLDNSWSDARRQCLEQGMRLPEPFEWQVSCDYAEDLNITGMTVGAEWASNSAFVSDLSNNVGAASPTMGAGNPTEPSGCGRGGVGFIVRANLPADGPTRNKHGFRCVM